MRTLDEVFEDPHTTARGMRIEMATPHVERGQVPLIGSPIHASATPPTYRHPPPAVGAHGREVLEELGLSPSEIDALVAAGVVALAA